MTTPGIPGNPTPATSSCPGTTRCISYQTEGSVRSRCGSPARRACPVDDFEGATAQLLLPSASPPVVLPARASEASSPSTIPIADATLLSAAPGGGNGLNAYRGAPSPVGWIGSWITLFNGNSASAA